jgi:predicted metal-binding membrane protein
VAEIAARAPGRPTSYAKLLALLGTAIAFAWLVCAWAELSGAAAQFHHHALYESGRPFWLSALLILFAWQVMTAAMMLPSSLGFIRMYAATAKSAPDFPSALALFLTAYFAVWTAFALLAFVGDMQLHRLVDGWPWLAEHANLVLAATLAFAASYQLTPLKDACLKACRHPGVYLMRHYRRGARNGLRIGLGHAAFCLGCCWALMLVMFAAGVAHLAWMGALALIMLIEKGTSRGERIVVPVGIALGLLAGVALFAPNAMPGL